jgi:hypothetical protein
MAGVFLRIPSRPRMHRVYMDDLQRDGDLLVVYDGVTLPHRCPVCNAPASGATATVRFGRSRRGRRSGVAVFLIGKAIERISDHLTGDRYTGPVEVRIRLCAVHRRQLRYLFAATLALLVGGAAGVFFVITDRISPWVGIPFLLALMSGVILVFGMASGFVEVFLRSRRFDDRRVWLRGACPEFLEDLTDVDR